MINVRQNSFYLALVIAFVATGAIILPLTFSPAPFVLGGVVVLGLAFWQWEPLLYLAVFLLPFAPIVHTDFPIHDLVALLRILIFAGVFLRKLLDRGRLSKWLWGSTVDKLAVLYLTIATASVLINPDAGSGIRALFRLVSYLSLYYTATAWIRSRSQLRNLIKVLFISTLLICSLGFYQFIANGYGPWFYWLYHGQEEYIEPFAGRITSVFLHVNPFAAFLNLVIPLALAMRAKSLDRIIARLGNICFFVAMVALFLTQSRGALLAFAVMLILAFRYLIKGGGARKRIIVQVVAAITIAVVAYQVRDRFIEQQTPESATTGAQTALDRFTELDEATLTRLVIYGRAWDFFVSSPVIGVGYGNFPRLFAPSIEGGPDSAWDTHNLYLKLLSETGLLGTLCYLALVVVVWRSASKGLARAPVPMESIVSFAILGATATMLTHGLVDVMLDVPQFSGLLWLLFAALPLARTSQENEAQ